MFNPPRRHFLTWDRPLVPQAVEFLAADWQGDGPLDLSATLVLVPTRQSGRRLREALAEFAGRRESAVFPPTVLTPEAFVAQHRYGDPTVAARLELLLAWIEVLLDIELAEFRDVFPVDPAVRNVDWAMQLAEQFLRLQTTLAENSLRIGDVARLAGPGFVESARWEQLGLLERRQDERLDAAGRRSPFTAPSDKSYPQMRGADIRHLVLLGLPDPLPSIIGQMQSAAGSVPIDVVVFAPEAESHNFDSWGRPVSSYWTSRSIDLPMFNERVWLCADPAEQALRVAGLAKSYQTTDGEGDVRDGFLGVGVADAEVLMALQAEANRHGIAVFNPEGQHRRGSSLFHLLTALLGCARSSTFDAVIALARCPDFLRFLQSRGEGRISAARLLGALDDIHRRHLPADLDAAIAHADGDVAEALSAIATISASLRGRDFARALADVLGDVFRGRMLEPSDPADVELQDSAESWTAVLVQCADAARRFHRLAPLEWSELALRVFGDTRSAEDKDSSALQLHGWLELLFEDAPHLVVAGMNDGMVPEAVSEDAFLPESLRATLGLKTNAARFARDAYLLQAIAACRRAQGRLDLLFAKTSAAGDPLRPSRLLLRCADADLPDRIAFLFREPDPVGSHLPWRRAWRLRPRQVAAPRKVAVTSLRRWLACPFRFYLKYALRMEAVDAAKSEMDAFDFGTLCHAALEAMGREPALRDCTDSTVLREFLVGELMRRAHSKFGAQLSLPLIIQVESARQRLSKFAEVQVREREAGWVVAEVERPFAVSIGGITVNGKIDRIDRNLDSGAVRVIDYKTSDAAVNPQAAHVRSLGSGETLPDWAIVTIDGKLKAWADLQLPLYRHALAPEFGNAISCGYVNLPKAIGATGLEFWEDYSSELHESAMHCAAGVCAAIERGEFWPPAEDIRAENDEFAPLFHRGVAASVSWEDAAPTVNEPRT